MEKRMQRIFRGTLESLWSGWQFPKSGSIAAALFRHLSFFLGTPIGCHLDWLLAKLVMQIIHDLTCLVAEICGDFLRQVIGLLSSCTTEVLELVEQSILQGAKSLKDLIPIVMNSIIEAVVKKSVEDLKQLKGITATYRMTNKPLPVRHSPYVSGVLHRLKEGVI
ncbi:Conserved oligomeric Golgi complex subunit 2 [Camellia lanceoleosa]|uniref:Conserved oligomeric Golgi complex subunit 2 n=1 Tax=Camellia lanceoleosa TaxID=1840588 RepID=A0ACC0GIV3_9ERIC|nr:Conserved oligomeric Golgi complex subunit 2 [Camellia lanceoleosa]